MSAAADGTGLAAHHTGSSAGAVLAAGAGTRFGGPKQLSVLAGRPLVGHALASLRDAGLSDVVVVVGPPWGEAVIDTLRAASDAEGVPAPVIARVAPGGDMGRSVATAAAQLGPRPFVMVLADQPRVPSAWVDLVVDALAAGAPAARVVHDDGPGHPVGFSSAMHERLVAADTRADVRGLLQDVGVTQVAVPGSRPLDVDRPADLRRLARDHHRRRDS